MLIAVTGTIATGATTLAKLIANIIDAETILESDLEKDNPFFSLAYQNPERFSFHNQIYFLTNSAERHRDLRSKMVKNKLYIEDFTPFEHTEVYAKVQYKLGRLNDDEFQSLMRLTGLLSEFFQIPSLIVFREQKNDNLFERIHDRGRPSEQKSDIEYLKMLNESFENWINKWDQCPVIRVPHDVDVITDSQSVVKISQDILSQLRLE